MNSYYILQVLESDSKSEYYVFRKWGRTGSTQGSHKLEEYGKSKNNAINQFEKLYLEKTGNDWEDRRNFQKKPGKMYPLEVDFGGGEQSNIEKMLAAGDTKKTYGGKLKPAVRSLIELIFDVKEMVRALVEMEIDINKMPLGKLSKNTLKEGFAVLSEVQTILDQVDADEKKETPEDEKTSSSQQDENAPNPIREKILKRYKDQLTTLSNKFYTVIPHTFDRNTGIAILDSRKLLKEKTEMVDALMEMEVATSLLNSNTGDSGEDTIDVNYKKLKTELEPLDHDSKEFKMLNEYLQNTHASTHSQYTMEAVDIFKVSREGEREAYVKEYGELKNKQLLWHGSRLTNWAGILSQG
jgi:poly [ADP-ribose] polymerase